MRGLSKRDRPRPPIVDSTHLALQPLDELARQSRLKHGASPDQRVAGAEEQAQSDASRDGEGEKGRESG